MGQLIYLLEKSAFFWYLRDVQKYESGMCDGNTVGDLWKLDFSLICKTLSICWCPSSDAEENQKKFFQSSFTSQ